MNSRSFSPSDADLDRLLRACGDRLIYPPTPDVVDALLQRMGASPGGAQARPVTGSPSERWDEPVEEADHSGTWTASASPFDLPVPRRRWRHQVGQALKLAAAILAFAVVTALLALVFRGFDEDGQPAVAPPVETATVTQERLYVVSDVYGAEEGGSVEVHGRVTVYDAETGDELYAIDVGSQVEAVLSLDGSRLFIADISGGGDSLIALDAATGRELWRTTIQDRVHRIMSLGPSTLAVSPDNQRVYVYGTDGTVQFVDANTGDSITDIGPTINCPAKLHVSPDGKTLYLICHERPGTMAIDLETGKPITDTDLSGDAASGTAVSPDGRLLYIVSLGRVKVVDMDQRTVIEQTSLDLDINPVRLLRLVALSLDGARLFVGLGTDIDPDSSAVSSREIAVFDTATWQETARITTETPVTGQTLAGAPGNQAVFAVHNAFREGTSIPSMASILKLSPDAEPSIFATHEQEEVLAIFTGQVEVPETNLPESSPTPPVEITLKPEPGWQIESSVASTIEADGDVSLRIEAWWPDGQLNLMWFVSTGHCEFEGDERLRFLYPPEKMLLRQNPDSSEPGHQQVTLVLDREWLSEPLKVGAFQVGVGDGPGVVCGDVIGAGQ